MPQANLPALIDDLEQAVGLLKADITLLQPNLRISPAIALGGARQLQELIAAKVEYVWKRRRNLELAHFDFVIYLSQGPCLDHVISVPGTGKEILD
jgi:hypothetical protein